MRAQARAVHALGLLVILISVVISGGAAIARTWSVLPGGGGDAPTIQAAVDSASAWDTVLLGNGTFQGAGNFDVDFLGKSIVVTSVNGPDSTTVDPQGQGPAFRFVSGEVSGSLLSGIAIVHGAAIDGGAIFIRDSSPRIVGNVIRECSATSSAGAIYVRRQGGGTAAPEINDNEIVECDAPQGGAIVVDDATPIVRNNVLSGNRATAGGGGAVLVVGLGAGPSIDRNTIHGNTATGNGGGVYVLIAGAIVGITENVLYDNSASQGGGLYFEGMSAGLIERNTVVENMASGGGSGIYLSDTTTTIFRTIVAFNTGSPGLSCSGAEPTVSCCLVSNNEDDAVCGNDVDNASSRPQFCERAARDYTLQLDSPATQAYSPCGEQIGALGIGCGTTFVLPATWGRIKSRYR